MTSKTSMFALLAILVAGCSGGTEWHLAEVPADAQKSEPIQETDPVPPVDWVPPAASESLPPEVWQRLDEFVARQLPDSSAPQSPRVVLDCEHYLTRVESEDFCSEEAPGDWESFEFEGETYFLQPLASAAAE